MEEPEKEPRIVELSATVTASARVSASMSVHTRLPIDHPFYASIGRVAALWAHLEHALDVIIAEMIGIDPPLAACVTAQMLGHAPRIRAIQALMRLKDVSPALIERAEKLKNKNYNVSEKRNRIVHDAWYIEVDTKQLGRFKSPTDRDESYGVTDVDEFEINHTIELIQKQLDEALDLRREISLALLPSPEKHLPPSV